MEADDSPIWMKGVAADSCRPYRAVAYLPTYIYFSVITAVCPDMQAADADNDTSQRRDHHNQGLRPVYQDGFHLTNIINQD